ncbi:MAG: DUF4837 family protein [Prevotellaceae bacterium]|jgi:hypothetical protein|nr:DUF4837 family protein [Prevotellaceae bacterium]
MKKLCYTLLLFPALLASCGDGMRTMQRVSGKAGEVVVVVDNKIWDKTVLDTVHRILAPDYPALPQREPVFDIIDMQETAFSKMFQLHRNIVLLKIAGDSVPEGLSVRHDVWAQPQTVVVVHARNGDNLIGVLAGNQERMIHILEQAERDRVIDAARKYELKALRDTVSKRFGGSPRFPMGYTLRKATPGFVWIGSETRKAILGVFMYSYPYRDSTTLRPQHIIAARNAILQREVPGQFENTYMTTASLFRPQTRNIRYKDLHFVETRGLWDIENDFMGGPFISHTLIDSTGEKALVLEAFVYHPHAGKRDYMRQLEAILYSFEWD